MDDLTIDPEELALFLAITEDLEKSRANQQAMGHNEDGTFVDIDFDQEDFYSNNQCHHRERTVLLRPFEQYVDDICTGKRSLWNDRPVYEVATHSASSTKTHIVLYYGLDGFDIYDFEKVVEGFDILQKNVWSIPALAVARICKELLQNTSEHTIPTGRSLLKKILADLTLHSKSFKSQKGVFITFDEGDSGLKLTYNIQYGHRTSEPLQSSRCDCPITNINKSETYQDDGQDDVEDVQAMIADAVSKLADQGVTVAIEGNTYRVSRCYKCRHMSVITGDREKYVYCTFDYRIDSLGICFRCGDEDMDMRLEPIEDRQELLEAVVGYLARDYYLIEKTDDSQEPDFKKCPKCGNNELIEAKKYHDSGSGDRYSVDIQHFCLNCRHNKYDTEYHVDDFSDITGPM